jgi:large subunit ribosomal protein L22
MGKPKHPRALPDNEARAVASNLRVSPRKLNLLAEMIRGKKVQSAIADLEFSRKRIADQVRKCVISAVANAENNHGLDVDSLIVAEAYVGKNLTIRRVHARGRGRAGPIEKPFAQITVVVREVDEAELAPKRKRSATAKEAV